MQIRRVKATIKFFNNSSVLSSTLIDSGSLSLSPHFIKVLLGVNGFFPLALPLQELNTSSRLALDAIISLPDANPFPNIALFSSMK